MGEFSLEPPRRSLFFHITFDAFDEGLERFIDTSPQSNDATVSNGAVDTTTGVIGQAGVFTDTNQLDIKSVDDSRTFPELMESAWHQSERPIPASDTNVQFNVTMGDGTSHTLSHTVNEDVTRWQFALAGFDGVDIVLYYARLGDTASGIVEVDRKNVGGRGDVDKFELLFANNGEAYADDVRMYDSFLSNEHRRNLFRIGNELSALDDVAEAWDNRGMPFIEGENNARFGGGLAEEKAHYFRQLDAIREARHIDDASGLQLDRYGQLAGVRRQENEGDDRYRARIKANVIAGRSSGTTPDVIRNAARIIETTIDRIEVQTQYDTDPGTIFLYIRTADLNDTDLTTSDVKTVMEDLVPAGHRVKVVEQGANPFTVIDDTMANDPDEGLTSDSISTGGGLVSDV